MGEISSGASRQVNQDHQSEGFQGETVEGLHCDEVNRAPQMRDLILSVADAIAVAADVYHLAIDEGIFAALRSLCVARSGQAENCGSTERQEENGKWAFHGF